MAEPMQYPSGLRLWTERALQRCSSQAEARHVAEQIQEKIAIIEANGELWSTRWESEPLPAVPEGLSDFTSYVDGTLLDSIGEVDEKPKQKRRSTKSHSSSTSKGSALRDAKAARVLAGKSRSVRGRGGSERQPAVAAPITEESIGRMFAKHDKNRSGTLDRKELRGVLKELGIDLTLSTSQAVLKELDTDHSGTLSLREFTTLCRKLAGLPEPVTGGPPTRPALSDVAITKIFNKHDRNKTGFLSRKELQPALRDLHVDVSRREAAEILRDYDVDGSNTLSLNEFTALCRRIGTMGEPFDRFDVEHCRRWVERRGLQPGGLGLDFAGDYATKGLYAYRGGKYDGMAFFGTGGTEEAMDAPPRLDQYRPHLEEAALLKKRPGSTTDLGASSARIISSASRADGKYAPAVKVAASLGRSIAGSVSKKQDLPEDRPIPREAPGAVVAAALARSIARPLKPTGEYNYDARLHAYQARQLASMMPAGQQRRLLSAPSSGEKTDTGCQADLPLTPLPPLVDVRRAFVKFAPPPPDFPDDHTIRRAFDIFDRDGSGFLSRRELREALRRIGLATDTLGATALLRAYDDDDSGSLGLSEFHHLVHDMMRYTAADLGHTSLAYRHVRAALRELGLDSVDGNRAAAAFRRYDDDGSRTLDLGEFVKFVEELVNIKAQQDDEKGSVPAGVQEIQNLVAKLNELKAELRTAVFQAQHSDLLGSELHNQRRQLSLREGHLKQIQHDLRGMLPRPSYGDTVLVCSANEIGNVAVEGGDEQPYIIDLPGGRSANVFEDNLLLQSDKYKERMWEEVELRTAIVRDRARLHGEHERTQDNQWSSAGDVRKTILAKMAPLRAKLRAKTAELRESRNRPRDQGVQCCSMNLQPYGEVMPPSDKRQASLVFNGSHGTSLGKSTSAALAAVAGGHGDTGPQEYKTEERVVLNGAARIITYTDLTTGVAHWQQPKTHGKFLAGKAPTTPPHSLWYKPGKGTGQGLWLGHNGMWPSGDTTFTLRFDVESPRSAHFELEYAVDNKLRSATLNGKPLSIGPSKGLKHFGGDMVISAPAGAGLFQLGINLLTVVVANMGKNASPMGFYARGRAVVGERVELADGSRPHSLVVRTFERYDINRTGALSRSELRTVLRDLGLDLTREQAVTVLREFDVDGSGTLSLAEFAALAIRLGFTPPSDPAQPHPAIVRVFEEFDTNRSGALSTRELRKGLGALRIDLSQSEALRVVRTFDADANGTLSLREFAELAYRLGFVPPPEEPASRYDPMIVQTFHRYDTNGTGALSRRELRSMLRDLGLDLTASQSAVVLRDFDDDGNGTLSLDEFATLASRLGFVPRVEIASVHPTILRAFNHVDSNRSGQITLDELQLGLRELGLDVNRSQALAILQDFDANASGTLDVHEFAKLAGRLGFEPPSSEEPERRQQQPAWTSPPSSPPLLAHSDSLHRPVAGSEGGFHYGVQGTRQQPWLWATLIEVNDRKDELEELRASTPGAEHTQLEKRRQALRQAEERLNGRRAELRGVLPRPRVGDRVIICAASSTSGSATFDTGRVTEDSGVLGLTVRMDNGKARRYSEEDLLLHDSVGGFPSEKVARLWQLETHQREVVAHAAERLRAEEASQLRRPADPLTAKLTLELDEVSSWLNQWSIDLLAKVSAQARALELLSLDLGALSAVTNAAPWTSADKARGRSQLLGLTRDVHRTQRHAENCVGGLR